MTTKRTRDFDTADILAFTHRMPIKLDPYIAVLAYLNERPASVLDSRENAAAWILELHPQLKDVTAPNIRSNEEGICTDDQLAAWDAWADGVKAKIGAKLPLQPIPTDHRDQRSLVEQVLDTGVDPKKVWLTDPS